MRRAAFAGCLFLAAQFAKAQSGEVWVPGGIHAFAVMAHLKGTPSPENFFLEYCRALIWEQSPGNKVRPPGYTAAVQAYIHSILELQRLGERRGGATVVTLSLADEAARRNTERILPLLGWKLVRQNGSYAIEPGDQPGDGPRQQIPQAFGIDEIDMQETLEAGREFRFSVASESAPLIGGAEWGGILKSLPGYPDGMAEVFSRDLHMAKVYAGLAAMGAETADGLIASVGLRTLVAVYPEVLASYADAFTLTQGQAATPGGAGAEPVWAKLSGASPRDPPAFFRALMQKDHGNLAAFYHALSRGDAAHQRFFTENFERAQKFYNWFRDSGEVFLGIERRTGAWHPDFLQNLPLDAAGRVRFPGGAHAWIASADAGDDALLNLDPLDALVPVARLEAARHTKLDEGAARLLAQHYSEWRPLFPYFEKLPGLGAAEFRALAAFSRKVAASPGAGRNQVMGEWHSLVELVVLGSMTGYFDAATGAQAFRHVCTDLAGVDHSAKALALLREITRGAEDPDEAVASNLLRLSGARRSAFDRIRELQRMPRLDSLGASPDAATVLAALSGLVYAALLDPEQLLVSEDPLLLSKHRFVKASEPGPRSLFCATELVSSSAEPGSYFRGGFMTIEELTKKLARSVMTPGTHPVAAASGPAPAEAAGPAPATVFHASARLVEVYATVADERGRYIDDLKANEFTILESGKPRPAVAFEARSSSLSVALLFDATGSMLTSLPALKSAALKLIGDLRPIDWVKVYSFSDSVTELQPFTTDKTAAKRAVLRTRAFGTTALYDALVRVNRDLEARTGKKVIVVFTDGADNASVLTMQTAIERAKTAGVPIYTIAQGEAVQTPTLLKQLAAVSRTTGGVAFAIHGPAEISQVFESVSQDLTHGYLLAFQPPPVEDHTWHPIEVVLRESKGRKVRAREGYFPD